MKKELKLSALGHTWIVDMDGTVCKHNGYKLDGADTILPGAEEFLASIPDKDMVIFLTSRSESTRNSTELFLHNHNIRYSQIIFDAPYGERILINDDKESGLSMSYAIRVQRNEGINIIVEEDATI